MAEQPGDKENKHDDKSCRRGEQEQLYKKQNCDHKRRCLHDPQAFCIYMRKAISSYNSTDHFSELIYDHKTADAG